MRAAALTLVVALAGACHYHRDANAPGLVDVRRPPSRLDSTSPEIPGDPGERMLVISPGLLGGGFIGEQGGGDFAAEVTVLYGESATSHNDNRPPFMMPPKMLYPQRGWGATLGWSALRVVDDGAGGSDATTGPIYVHAQRHWMLFGAGAGLVVDPRSGDIGPELVAWASLLEVRLGWRPDAGVELVIAYQLKWPFTWVWSR